MPLAGTLREMVYVPGRLFSVNQTTAENVPELFARNERVVCLFDTERGPMAVVLVGAMIVASIETVWAGLVTPPKRELKTFRYDEAARAPIRLEKAPSSVASSWAPPPSSCSARSRSRSTTASGQRARCAWANAWPCRNSPDLAGTERPERLRPISPRRRDLPAGSWRLKAAGPFRCC